MAPVADGKFALALDVRFPDPRKLPHIVERARALFDLSADPALIATQLRADPVLRRALERFPGIRVPGAWDGFELTVRAILGQQVSVAAATTIAGRIAETFGIRPETLVHAPLERCGVMPARAETIRVLAQRIREGSVTVGPSLTSIPGIGEWTAQYVAMRALNDPDAFPSGDLILRRAAGNCTARELERRSQAWRPWRAYAVMLLWRSR